MKKYAEYFMGEFAAPLRTLRLMHESIIAGLNNQQLTEQIKQFKEELDDILRDVAVMDMDHLRGYCTPLLYDGELFVSLRIMN